MQFFNIKMRAEKDGFHISGHERIVRQEFVDSAIKSLSERAFNHPNGSADFVNIKIAKIKKNLAILKTLRVNEIFSVDPKEAKTNLKRLLSEISNKPEEVLGIFYSLQKMSGAALIDVNNLSRLDSDEKKGVRVSSMDLATRENVLDECEFCESNEKNPMLEALVLASKVASCPGYIAEVCASDDINYTTGYFASRKTGYIRIHNIKESGSVFGARLFIFRKTEEITVHEIKDYLKNHPVIFIKD